MNINESCQFRFSIGILSYDIQKHRLTIYRNADTGAVLLLFERGPIKLSETLFHLIFRSLVEKNQLIPPGFAYLHSSL